MRILHVTDAYYPAIGGLERSVRTLAHYQVNEMGDVVAVLTAEYEGTDNKDDDSGVTIYRIPMLTQKIPGALQDKKHPFHPTQRDPLFMNGMRKVLEEFKPDIIHAHGWNVYSVIPLAKKHSIPVLLTAHDYGHVCAVKTFMMNGSESCSGPEFKKCLQHAYHHYGVKGIPIAAGVYRNMKQLQQIQLSPVSRSVAEAGQSNPHYAIPNTVVVPSYAPDYILNPPEGSAPEWLPDEPYLLYVGALTPLKGLVDVLTAHANLQKRTPIPLVVIGTPQAVTPDFTGYTNVIVKTDVPHLEVMHAWRNAHIGLAPSNWAEPFGQVVVEALASKTPIITTDHGGPKDIITHMEDGILVPPNSPDKIEEAIILLLESPELMDRLKENGYQTAEKYTIKTVAPEIRELYLETIKK